MTTGAIVAFVALQHQSEEAQAKLTAVAEARHALTTLTRDLTQAELGPASETPVNLFVGTNTVLAAGNRKDDDGDGRIDEETFDGIDNDSDWSSADDRHAQLSGALYERPQGRGVPDLGDAHVDEDTKFSHADLRFRIPAETTGTSAEVHYYVGTFDNQPDVLIRETVTSSSTEASPIAFNVLSFSALFWNGNTAPTEQHKWETSWDATNLDEVSNVPLPISVALEVTTYAGRRPYSELPATSPIDTVMLTTVVNIQRALVHPNYKRNSFQ
jgi:hypothetical protein